MENGGYLVISLDFELLWGVFDVVDYRKKKSYFENARRTIPVVLKVFEEHDIHATWAVVGMLFNQNWEEWEKSVPNRVPEYNNDKLSAYKFGESIKGEKLEKLVFAPELIKAIKVVNGQEIATHTYSHFYCLEEGQSHEDFKADLLKAIEKASEMGIELKSLVFPRNQLKQEYLKICGDLGIKTVRSNPTSWYWKDTLSENLLTKVARSGDAYIPLGAKTYKAGAMDQKKDFPMEQKASRFLKPVEENQLMRRMKVWRVKNEITRAARKKEVYHLWWHPHNFGEQPEESIKDLQEILKHFEWCRKKYSMQSINMQELHGICTYTS